MTYTVRPYVEADERSWVRCRVLGFLDSSYYDDVQPTKPDVDALVQLVADSAGEVIGLIDASLDGTSATLESVAVHPDHRRRGVADALLAAARPLLRDAGAQVLTAWTRQDPPASAWYARNNFTESFRYLHVHATDDLDAVEAPAIDGMRLVAGFFHADLADEARLRASYRRVYVCRSMELDLTVT